MSGVITELEMLYGTHCNEDFRRSKIAQKNFYEMKIGFSLAMNSRRHSKLSLILSSFFDSFAKTCFLFFLLLFFSRSKSTIIAQKYVDS